MKTAVDVVMTGKCPLRDGYGRCACGWSDVADVADAADATDAADAVDAAADSDAAAGAADATGQANAAERVVPGRRGQRRSMW